MADVIKIPKKKKASRGARMGSRQNTVSTVIDGAVDSGRSDDIDSSGINVKSTRSLIFNDGTGV